MSGTRRVKAVQEPRAYAPVSLLYLIAALACFAILDTTTKWVTAEVPLVMALWALFLIQVLGYSALLVTTGRVAQVRCASVGTQLARGVLLLMVQALAFLSLHYLPVGEFTAVAMTTPLLVTLLAGRFLGEHVSLMRILLVLGGFAGTLIIVRPGANALGWIILLPLGLVVVNAAYQLLTSWMARTQDAMITLFYTSAVCLALCSCAVAFFWQPVHDLHLVAGLLLMGAAALCGNLLFIKAFERSGAAPLMPYMYLQIGFGLLGGWFMFAHMPDAFSLFGMALIALCGVAGGVLTLHEQHSASRP